jgi:branched-chain amino acid transport system permease protein
VRRLPSLPALVPCIALLAAVAAVGSLTSASTQQDFITALVSATIVFGLYIFVGNSGVISFGHVSFVAVGAFLAGLMTIEEGPKQLVMPDLWPVLAEHSTSSFVSLVLAAVVGGAYALIVGIPLMRLSGIAAGIATFAVLAITHNVLTYSTEIGPGATTLALVPATTGLLEAFAGASFAAAVAFAYASSRRGRLLRAAREDPAAARAIGVSITAERVLAFALSGAVCGLAGGLLVHQLGSITTDQVYLELTFLTLAMLVIGGAGSLWGATVGALGVSLLTSFLTTAESGVQLEVVDLKLPTGSAMLLLGLAMTAVLVLRPAGLAPGGNKAGRG